MEIGGTKLQLFLSETSLANQEYLCLEVDQENGAEGIRNQIIEGIKKLRDGRIITATGVGFGGPINYKTGKISVSHQIEGWKDFNLLYWLQDLTASPVIVDNDANIAALGEAVYGAGASYKNVFYMTIGSGIGGGLAINRKIYHGAHPGEVEIGHVLLNKNGDTLESSCSGWAVDKKIRRAIAADPEGVLAELVGGATKNESTFLKSALLHGDPAAEGILDEITGNIGFALSHVVHLLHPEVILIGGGISLLGDHLRDPVADVLPGYVMQSFLPGPEIKIATLGEKVVPIGALELARISFTPTGL